MKSKICKEDSKDKRFKLIFYTYVYQILIVWLIWMMEHCLQFQYHSLVSPWFHCKSQCLLRCPSCKAWHADSSIQYCIANWLLLHAHPLKNYRQANRKTIQEPGGCKITQPLLLQDSTWLSQSFYCLCLGWTLDVLWLHIYIFLRISFLTVIIT